MLSGLSGKSQTQKYENMILGLGGSVIRNIKDNFDVLVITSVTRSIKFLLACNIGARIVSLKWLEDSKEKKEFLEYGKKY